MYVSYACLHWLRWLLRFSLHGVTMHAFHTRVCIGYKTTFAFSFVWHLQYIRITRVSASVKTAFVIFGIVSQCMRFPRVSARLRRLLRFLSYGVTIYAFHTFSASVKTTSAFSLVWRYNACD